MLARDLLIRRSGNYARFLDTFSNTGDSDVTIDVSFGGVLGLARGNAQSAVAATSSGDSVIRTDDAWVSVSTPTPGYSANSPSAIVLGTPAPFHGISGVGNFQRDPFLTPLATSGQQANFYGFNDELTLRPGETRSLVRYLVGRSRRDERHRRAGGRDRRAPPRRDLAAAPDLGGLTAAQICSIANWDLTALTIPNFSAAACVALTPLTVAAPAPAGGADDRRRRTTSSASR